MMQPVSIRYFFLSSRDIITAKKLDIFPLLGEIHMLMLFYGSIGTIMDGSGISKLFECVYALNAVKHMVTGKAVSQENRAYLLTESALMINYRRLP